MCNGNCYSPPPQKFFKVGASAMKKVHLRDSSVLAPSVTMPFAHVPVAKSTGLQWPFGSLVAAYSEQINSFGYQAQSIILRRHIGYLALWGTVLLGDNQYLKRFGVQSRIQFFVISKRSIEYECGSVMKKQRHTGWHL